MSLRNPQGQYIYYIRSIYRELLLRICAPSALRHELSARRYVGVVVPAHRHAAPGLVANSQKSVPSHIYYIRSLHSSLRMFCLVAVVRPHVSLLRPKKLLWRAFQGLIVRARRHCEYDCPVKWVGLGRAHRCHFPYVPRGCLRAPRAMARLQVSRPVRRVRF